MLNLSINMSSMRRSLTSEVKSERRVPNNSISAIKDEDDGKDLVALITNLMCIIY